MTTTPTNEQQQQSGQPYFRASDMTPDQFETMLKRAIYRGGSVAVLVGVFGVAAVCAIIFVAVAMLTRL